MSFRPDFACLALWCSLLNFEYVVRYVEGNHDSTLGSAGYTGIGIVGFFIIGIFLTICRCALRRNTERIRSQQRTTSTQSLLRPEHVIINGSSVSSPGAPRSMLHYRRSQGLHPRAEKHFWRGQIYRGKLSVRAPPQTESAPPRQSKIPFF